MSEESAVRRQMDDVYETPSVAGAGRGGYLRQPCLHRGIRKRSRMRDSAASSREGFDASATNDNFLLRTSLPCTRIDGICTNPPFGTGGRLACQFIARALELVPVIAMLLRIDFDRGKTRTHLFSDCPAFDRKIVLLDRIVWFEREGAPGPSENHAWYIWNARHRGSPTISYARRSR